MPAESPLSPNATGSAKNSADNPSVLAVGTRLGEFELQGVLGIGGFGVVYLAFDHALEREVALKEYMPAALAGRTETMQVSLRSQSDAETFALGLKSFVNEARLLARFDHPSLVKVHRFWEANGTAYMAMPVMRGATLKQHRAMLGHAPDEAWTRAVLEPLLGALEKLHAEGVYHRDIAPDNILIEPDGRPVLLDFGAARRVIGDRSQNLTAILKPAYAPIEQYGEAGAVRQGPWTDLYALGATLHQLLLGRPPAPATARAVFDDASGLSADQLPGYSEAFLHTVEWMLAPRPADRPQSVAELRAVLAGEAEAPRRRPADAAPVSSWERTVVHRPSQAADTRSPAAKAQTVPTMAEAPTVRLERVETAEARAAMAPSVATAVVTPTGETPAVPAPAPRRRPVLPLAAAGLAALAVAGYALWPAAQAPQAAAPLLAASAPVLAASVPDVAAALPAPVPASSTSESAIVPVILPGARVPTAAAAAGPPAPASASAAGKSAVAPGAATRAPAKNPALDPTPPRTEAATVPPVVATPRPQAIAPAPPSTNPAAARAPEPAPAAATVVGPEATCGGRRAVAHFVCMERLCLRGEFQKHADCQKWRAAARPDTQ